MGGTCRYRFEQVPISCLNRGGINRVHPRRTSLVVVGFSDVLLGGPPCGGAFRASVPPTLSSVYRRPEGNLPTLLDIAHTSQEVDQAHRQGVL